MPDMMFQALDLTGLNETAEQVRAILQEAKAEIEAELDSLDYAQPDGIYPDMAVGAVIGADETSQWAQRESTGSGTAIVRSVQGASVVWNQLIRLAVGSSTSSGVTFTKRADGSVTLEGAATSANYFSLDSSLLIPIVAGHKYLAYGPSSDDDLYLHIPAAGLMAQIYGGQIYTANQDSGSTSFAYLFMKATFSGTYTFTPQLFDLTAMFGSGSEPSTVEEFERMYPLPYYPYSAPVLKPVQIAGIQSKDAQGNALDSIEWQAKTLRAAGSIADELTDDALVTRVGMVDLGTLTWVAYNASTYPNLWYANIPERANSSATTSNDTNWNGYPKNTLSYRSSWDGIRDNDKSWTIYPVNSSYPKRIWINDSDYAGLTGTQVAAALSGKMAFYELATPTTQPISPALPMTYRVQADGSESIIVPDGEISAAPIITVAEPVNMSTELARIWAAIEALQGSRGSALGSVRSDSDVSSTEVKEAPTMDEKQTTERESEI